jgi:hypothetical protein
MVIGLIETALVFGVAAWIPFKVDQYFTANLIPLPSWPYGLGLAVFAFFFTKTIFVFFRSLIRPIVRKAGIA